MTKLQTGVKEVDLYINGEYVKSSNQATFEVKNPATQEVIAYASEATKEDVDKACQAAREAFEHGPWRTMTVAERCNKLRRMAEIMLERKKELASLDAADVGKPYEMALGMIPRAAKNISFFADFFEQQGGEAYPMDDEYLNYTRYEPVGVASLITPWNVPFMLTNWKLGPCLAAGNTAVIKPAETTPLSVALLGEIAKEAGIPDGVVNVVHGLGNVVGTALTEHPEVDLVSFTGSTATAKKIMENGAASLKKVSFELGGKAANIVFEDASLEKAIPESIRAAFMNSGQVCLAGSRILVQRSILDEFIEKFKEAAMDLKVGDPQEEGTKMGPVVSEEHYKKVTSYLDIAKEENATLICGGKRPELPEHLQTGFYLEPTVYVQEDHTTRLCQEEIFGPVVTIIPFDTEEEALHIANDTDYGLNGVVWTENLQRAHRISHNVRAGTIWVNCWFVRDLRAPFGGFKKSGIGREGGHHSIEFFTEAKNICIALK
ncbi:aminomuconate-semialdehyde/2-hydroxymuconate-6-semialdehyde dehydrogenase [Alteribacillus persepolensis]|uniref:Aminomuconate-semialdehyde/2-hydroxymuconate-6-semialdehyde dehydrogenase n=1 Tax=Alteribacillus persepolensis TaxID=568899 RepID=A0A1G8EH55_9BACI|nr:aldehyde dehydrogenase [Alteribacillus persepolensis]SDH69245.1 aminomuconate-semialdehyde/2-hydroxymuconate-6-semialdehyde dehydrogenase [Alteribacillus persepolensis]